MEINKVYLGDSAEVLREFPDESIDCCVTSPPYYGLRDYGVDGQIGLEETPEEFIAKLISVFHEVKRVLKKDGTCWVNIGDSYAGSGKGAWKNKDAQKESYVPDPDSPQVHMKKEWDGIKSKDLIGIPWMLAFALRADGWYLRQDIIWAKPNAMPESVTDRCVKSHEYIFLLSKSEKYWFDYRAIQEEASVQELSGSPRFGGSKYGDNMDSHYVRYSGLAYSPQLVDDVVVRNKRDVWTITTKSNKEAHFATFPEDLITPCILAGCKRGGIVLDPFMGSGTTGIVARNLSCYYVGIELNPKYHSMAERRIFNEGENLFNQE